mgnify:FL=1
MYDNIFDALELVRKKALQDEAFKMRLISTRHQHNPVTAFCRVTAGL